MATGAEILSYRGNPALGGGFDPNGVPFVTSNPLSGLEQTFQQLNNQQFQYNVAQYQQKVRDRDDVLSELNQNQIDFEVADMDRPELEKKQDELKDILLAKPNLKSDPKAYLDFKQKQREFIEMATSSKSRSIEYKKQFLEAAADPNSERRRRRFEHLDEQMKRGILHQVDPFFQVDLLDKAKLYPQVAERPLGAPKASMDGNGVFTVTQEYETPLKEITRAFYPTELARDDSRDRLNQVQLLFSNMSDPQYAAEDKTPFWTAVNAKLSELNTSNALSPDSPDYLQPAATKADDGRWIINQSPAEFAKSMAAFDLYKKEAKQDPKMAEAYQKQSLSAEKEGTERSKQALNAASGRAKLISANSLAALRAAQARLAGAKAGTESARARLMNAKAAKEEEKEVGMQAASDLVNTFHNAYNRDNFRSLADVANVGNPALKAQVQGAIGQLGELGINEQWQIADVPAQDQGVRKMLSIGATNDKGKVEIKSPARVVVLRSPDGDINKTKLVGFDKKGNVMKVIDPNSAVGEIVKYESRYATNPNLLKEENNVRNRIEYLQGRKTQGVDLQAIVDNVGSVTTTYNSRETSRRPDPQQAAAGSNVVKVPVARSSGLYDGKLRKDPSTNSNQVYINGQWRNVTGVNRETKEVYYE